MITSVQSCRLFGIRWAILWRDEAARAEWLLSVQRHHEPLRRHAPRAARPASAGYGGGSGVSAAAMPAAGRSSRSELLASQRIF